MKIQIDSVIYEGTAVEILNSLRDQIFDPTEFPDTETYLWFLQNNVIRSTGKDCALPKGDLEAHAALFRRNRRPTVTGGVSRSMREEMEQKRPSFSLVGQDGNIFHLLTTASRVLQRNGMAGEAKEMWDRVLNECSSYGEALSVLSEYVETELSHPKEQTQKKKARNVHER